MPTVTLTFNNGYKPLEFNLEAINYAIGVARRAGAPNEEGQYFSRKITAIKHLRMEKGFGLLEAKTLIEFAWDMIKTCEGMKFVAVLNPID